MGSFKKWVEVVCPVVCQEVCLVVCLTCLASILEVWAVLHQVLEEMMDQRLKKLIKSRYTKTPCRNLNNIGPDGAAAIGRAMVFIKFKLDVLFVFFVVRKRYFR